MHTNLPTVTLGHAMHRDREILSIRFDKNITLEQVVRALPYVKWSQTRKFWYLNYSNANKITILERLSGIACIETGQIKFYEDQKRYNMHKIVLPDKEIERISGLENGLKQSVTANRQL